MKKLNESQQRLLRVQIALRGVGVLGVSVTALSRSLDAKVVNILRDLENLKVAGFAERVPSNPELWREGSQSIAGYRQYSAAFLDDFSQLLKQAQRMAGV